MSLILISPGKRICSVNWKRWCSYLILCMIHWLQISDVLTIIKVSDATDYQISNTLASADGAANAVFSGCCNQNEPMCCGVLAATMTSRTCAQSHAVPFISGCYHYQMADGHNRRCFCDDRDFCNSAPTRHTAAVRNTLFALMISAATAFRLITYWQTVDIPAPLFTATLLFIHFQRLNCT